MNPGCPIPREPGDVIQMAHGGGGRMARRLMDRVFLPALNNPALAPLHDAGLFSVGEHTLAMTTDGFVVHPWRFPGGDIGSLSIHGTVNDLAMAGARALAISAAFVLEEGLPVEGLEEAVGSMREAALACGVPVVAGDTKVVERGKGDGLYVVTTGIGVVESRVPLLPAGVREGDAVLLSGDVGRHGAAVMSVREGLELNLPVLSDSAPVAEPALALIRAGLEVHCMRDCTRGGLATVLNELAEGSGHAVRIDERSVPVSADVRGLCELFGLDPLYVACEGRFVVFVPADQAGAALRVLQDHRVSAGAVQIGEVVAGAPRVTMTSAIGVERVLDLLSGEQLPRIC